MHQSEVDRRQSRLPRHLSGAYGFKCRLDNIVIGKEGEVRGLVFITPALDCSHLVFPNVQTVLASVCRASSFVIGTFSAHHHAKLFTSLPKCAEVL